MRLLKIQQYLKEKELEFDYTEQENLGSNDFEYRGVGLKYNKHNSGTYEKLERRKI